MSNDSPSDLSDSDLVGAAEVFSRLRPRLFGIAYRMLGSASDAEDIVQEAWLRWQSYDRSTVNEPAAFLATITTRLAINLAQSAKSRRETYIGPWLPEPVDTSADPLLGAERAEALEFAVLLLLEKLTPTERAAYVLREAFDYPYGQIAAIIQVSEVATRQLVSRARKHLVTEKRVAPVSASEQRRLLSAFVAAAQTGDVIALEELFAADVVSYTDGNGVKLAARIPVSGRERVTKFVAAFSSHFWVGKVLKWAELNGRSALTLSENGVVTTTVTISASEAGIQQLLWTMNPDKLSRIASPSA